MLLGKGAPLFNAGVFDFDLHVVLGVHVQACVGTKSLFACCLEVCFDKPGSSKK